MSDTYNIRIQQYQLFDIRLQPYQILKFMSDTFALVNDNEEAFSDIDGGTAVFHNRKNTYSLIQFNADKAYPIITAYGDNAIKALDIWFELFREQNTEKTINFKQSIEHYRFVPEVKEHSYHIKNFLINHERYDKIKNAGKIAFYEELGQYVVNMFLYFLTELSYRSNDNDFDIKVRIINAVKHKQYNKTYKYASKFPAYEITFDINVRLPQNIALGIATAKGLGVVKQI